MSTGSVSVRHLSRGWRAVIFAPAGDGQRRRRGSDGVRLAAAVLADVHPAARQVWGVARYEATEDCRAGLPGFLDIEVYGRNAADARLLTKAGRFLLYRDSGPSLTITRLQQVEHQAYLTLRPDRAGVTVPQVLEAGTAGPSNDALLVCRRPAGTTPISEMDAADISDATLDEAYRQLMLLRSARIAHGAISGDALLAGPVNTVVVTDFRNATAGAMADQCDRDLAGAIAAMAVVAAAERAADCAARCLDPQLLAGALRHLHKPALDPPGRGSVMAAMKLPRVAA